MRETISKFQKETGNDYNLEATPPAGMSFRLSKRDKLRFKHIEATHERNQHEQDDIRFYTNSIHRPMEFTNDLFEP
jgi:ribonucleoside-triphosphate reductase